MGGREGGRNDRGGGGDRSGGSAFFNLVIDSSDERSQAGVLHVVGEDEWDHSWGRAREIIRGGKAGPLCVDDDCVPTSVAGCETRKMESAYALTCVAQSRREGQARRIQ